VADDSARKAFGSQIKAWREALDRSQADVDERVGKARGFTAQIETGRLKPPPKDLCDMYDVALERETGETWALAAPVRIQDADPDLFEWHRAQLEAVRGFALSPSEESLLGAVASLEHSETFARDLATVIEVAQVEPGPGWSARFPPVDLGGMKFMAVEPEHRARAPGLTFRALVGNLARRAHRSPASLHDALLALLFPLLATPEGGADGQD
jgi:transcriptional regulator with XRE-family HTH domain